MSLFEIRLRHERVTNEVLKPLNRSGRFQTISLMNSDDPIQLIEAPGQEESTTSSTRTMKFMCACFVFICVFLLDLVVVLL